MPDVRRTIGNTGNGGLGATLRASSKGPRLGRELLDGDISQNGAKHHRLMANASCGAVTVAARMQN